MNSPLVTLFGREFVQNRQEKSLKTEVFRQIVFDNTGFNIIIQLLGMCIPVGVRSVIEYCEKSNPYMDCKTFAADLCMTYRKIKFEGNFVKDYFYEIDRASERNGIQRELLRRS